MTFLNRIKKIFNPEPKEQVLGYSPSELQHLFQNTSATVNPGFQKNYPKKSSLESAGIHAFYASQLIDKEEMEIFLKRVDSYFQSETKRVFSDTVVTQSKAITTDERLCYLLVKEFGGVVIKLVTDSVRFLNLLAECNFSMPPPWLAFSDYKPQWWGGSMQGAQAYYDDCFFSSFFASLSIEDRKKYFAKHNASQDWEKALELFYDIETD
ncbi:hypothetical protein [Paraherbaspirillum soli]|uniref:Uncharacterized protein n=1 Tax=Paraherbaspirillum soli TaxID=631222 RepID=A0ABW0ME80_9BURK